MKKKRAVIASDPIGRYREILSPEATLQLEACLMAVPPSAVRFNPLKGSPLQMTADFQPRIGWSLQPIPFCPDGYTLNTSRIPPGRSLEARLGYFYIQDAASMLPVELFETTNAPAPLILDLTAAPGGKSTHLASRFHDRGILIANDGTASRIPALTSTLKTWGTVSSAVTNIPGEMFGLWFPETFDYVLLDAPCSMENLHFGDKNKRDIQSAERGRLAQRQAQLLISAIKACKVGGQVVYSTCTLAPEEDEGVLDAVSQAAGNAIEITQAGTRKGISAPGLTEAFGQKYNPETAKSVRLWPHLLGTSGFFTAHIQKIGALPDRLTEGTHRPFNRTNLAALQTREIQQLSNLLLQNYGFILTEVLSELDLSLATYKQSVYIFPHSMDGLFPGVPFRSTGLRLGDYSQSGFEISLEWATRFGEKIISGVLNLPEENRRAWSRGEDLPAEVIGQVEKGSILVIKDNHSLVMGTGRVSARGLKNLLPRHLALKS